MRAVLAILAPKRALWVAPGGCSLRFPCVARHGLSIVGRVGKSGALAEAQNLNLIIGGAVLDPVSGTASHRAYLCEIRRSA
jgi:hypothetical protein